MKNHDISHKSLLFAQLHDDPEVLAVQVLDEITAEIIKALGIDKPRCLLDWVSHAATSRVGKLAKELAPSNYVDLTSTERKESLHQIVLRWLTPQLMLRYGDSLMQLPAFAPTQSALDFNLL